jgi:tetratricopeptide (TPR) repeat protein
VVVLLACIGLGAANAGLSLWAARYYRAAGEAFDRRDYADARSNLERYFKLRGDSADAHLLAARIARRTSAYDEADRELKTYQQQGGLQEYVDLERALARAQRGDVAPVEEKLFGAAEGGHPDAVMILEALTQGYLQRYQFGRVSECLKLWLGLRPDDVLALTWRADLYERRNRFDDALPDLRRVVELTPERDEARLHLADALGRARLWEEARGHYEQLKDRQPHNPAVLLGLARCRMAEGNAGAAQQLLDGVLALDPKNADALNERGKLALDAGQLAEAEGLFRKAYTVAPYDRETVYSLYQCLRREGKDAPDLKSRLDTIEARLDRLRQLTKQIAQSPHDAALRYEAGKIFLDSEQPREGLRWLGSALAEDPRHQPTHQALAEYYERAGDPAMAARHRELAGAARGGR